MNSTQDTTTKYSAWTPAVLTTSSHLANTNKHSWTISKQQSGVNRLLSRKAKAPPKLEDNKMRCTTILHGCISHSPSSRAIATPSLPLPPLVLHPFFFSIHFSFVCRVLSPSASSACFLTNKELPPLPVCITLLAPNGHLNLKSKWLLGVIERKEMLKSLWQRQICQCKNSSCSITVFHQEGLKQGSNLRDYE